MPQDYITAAEHAERRRTLQQSRAEAQTAFDEALLSDETGKAAREAHINMEHLGFRLEALDRLRVLSAAREKEQADLDRAERDKQRAADIHECAAGALSAARKAEKSLQAFIADVRAANEQWVAFGTALSDLAYDRLGSEHPRLEAILMTLSHRFEGPAIVGRLEAADVAGLHLVDDPIVAMRQHGSKRLDGLVGSRIGAVLRQARIDIPELKEVKRAYELEGQSADGIEG